MSDDLSESLAGQARRELLSQRCVCGNWKRCGHSFCVRCFRSLSPKTRSALYTPFSEGYAEIYDRAKEELRCASA